MVAGQPGRRRDELDPALHDRVLASGLAAAARRRRPRQGRHAVPARALPSRDAGRLAGGERRAGACQRPPRRRGRCGRRPIVRPRMTGPRVVCVGDLMVDVSVRLAGPPVPGSDTPARISVQCGGQAANVAAGLATEGVSATLVGRVGDDLFGRRILDELPGERLELNVSVDPVLRPESASCSSTRAVSGRCCPMREPTARWVTSRSRRACSALRRCCMSRATRCCDRAADRPRSRRSARRVNTAARSPWTWLRRRR